MNIYFLAIEVSIGGQYWESLISGIVTSCFYPENWRTELPDTSLHFQLSHQLSWNPRNIAKFSRDGGFKPKLKAEILQNSQEVGFLKTKITSRNIEKVSRGGSYKTETQAEIVQKFQAVKFKISITGKNIAHSWKYEPTLNESRKARKKLRLYWGDWVNSMEHIFISGSSYGCNKCFYKRKSKFLKLNGTSHFKRRRRLRHKGCIHMCSFCWYVIPGQNTGGKWAL